jgi:hypothetical protein
LVRFRPDRYVPLFGGGAYDIANEREGDIPFDEQLRGLEEVVKAGKVRVDGFTMRLLGLWSRLGICQSACVARVLPFEVSVSSCHMFGYYHICLHANLNLRLHYVILDLFAIGRCATWVCPTRHHTV